jgi:starch-binding outer membrane protein, SusD/RagB family
MDTMTRTFQRYARRGAVRTGALALGVMLVASCNDFDVRNVNAPTEDALTENPTKNIMARTAVGIQTEAFNDLAAQIQQWGIYGREGYHLLGNDPRETGEEISGPQDPGGRAGGQWVGKYGAIRTINAYLAVIDNVPDMTPAEISASKGFAKTLKAYHLHRLAIRSGPTGVPIDVDRPIDADPAPLVPFDQAMEAASDLFDEALADLQAAGGVDFPFNFVPGYSGFEDPVSFQEFNRALAAKLLVHRATFNDCTPCWGEASTALSQSFVTDAGLPGSLATGVYFGYTGAAGELGNPITETLTNNRYWVHPSLITDAQTQPGGQPDQRLLDKTAVAPAPRTFNNLTGTHKPVLYNSGADPAVPNLGADIPWITNEELLLLRAEVRWFTGDKPGALADIDRVRQHAGGLAPTSLTAGSSDDAFITELLYNRLYSLMWTQGTRWIDARRYDRLADLPLDRSGDVVHPHMLIPSAECDARGFDPPCSI